MLVPYRAFEARDRYIVVAAGNNNLFKRLCETLGHPEWIEDGRFVANANRIANREVLNGLIGAVIATKDADHWIAALDAVGVPCAPINSVSEVLQHPQTSALGMLHNVEDKALGLVATPLSFDGARPPLRSMPPKQPAALETSLVLKTRV